MGPEEIQTRRELADRLDALRIAAGLTYPKIERLARSGSTNLAKSTVHDMCRGKVVPEESSLLQFLQMCGVPPSGTREWLGARHRAFTAEEPGRWRMPRVRDARPRLIGVHRAIEIPGAEGELPSYVLRDLDARLRASIRAGSEGAGRFLLLVGPSSVGKTRSAFEALRAEVPDWWIFHPADAAECATFAAEPVARSVVWLDEIQRYLAGGLSPDTVRRLQADKGPLLVIATLWPDLFHSMKSAAGDGQQVLDLAETFMVPPEFSPSERDRAVAKAAADPRLAAVIDSEYGLTQALAAGPELIGRWEGAPDPYARALLTAAIDARRMGIWSPLSAELLRTAVPDYLSAGQRARATSDWFEVALRYAMEEVRGAASALTPSSTGMGTATGYHVEDFLFDHARRVREVSVPPESAWLAYRTCVTNGEELVRAAHLARRRGLFEHAEHLLRAAVAAGYARARHELTELLRGQGRLREVEQTWREATHLGEPESWRELEKVLHDLGRIEEAQKVIFAGAAAGDEVFRCVLAELLREQGRLQEAIELLQRTADDASSLATNVLAEFLHEAGRTDDAVRLLYGTVGTSEGDPYFNLVPFLLRLGRVEEALRLRYEAVADDRPWTRSELVQLLKELDRLDEAEEVLRAAAAGGDVAARLELARFLTDNGAADEGLRIWAEALRDNPSSVKVTSLAMAMRDHGRAEEGLALCRERFEAGARDAWFGLVWMLEAAGRMDEAMAVYAKAHRAEPNAVVLQYARFLDEHGQTEEALRILRQAAPDVHSMTHYWIAPFLEKQGDTAEAERHWRLALAAGAGESALDGLVALLRVIGRGEEADMLRRYGVDTAGRTNRVWFQE
ncbi:tetratricopeptide repeat protein [Micromonospora sp. NPDC047707]|uniref:tetratricopeptide repeat protein n=1 Tax=Micromonospora sp. NPDC047707 TaxID=3154498 RepID=UPI003452B613